MTEIPFVHLKESVCKPLFPRKKLPASQGATFRLLTAAATMELAPAEEIAWLLCWLKSTQSSNAPAVAGGSQLKRNDGSGWSALADWPNSLRLSLAEGRRGAHERNC